jgi:hypothetical protein
MTIFFILYRQFKKDNKNKGGIIILKIYLSPYKAKAKKN